jgi:hypothetical protein
VSVVEPDYQPYQAGAFRWRLGLRPLDLDDWIQIGPDYEVDLARKRAVLERHADTVLSWLPGIEPEATEVLDALADHLGTRFPHWFRADDRQIHNVRTGEVHERAGDRHPLDVAGRLVQEDVLLMVRRDDRLVFGGGSVCFPNRWDLPSKVGRTMAEVHAPVPRLNDQLRDPIDGFFDRLTPERSFWRLGWGVLDTDERYQPTDGTAPPRPGLPAPEAPDVGDRLFLRVERETLRRFPRTGCVLFTIRTYVRPLAHLADRPDDVARLAEALRAMPDDVAAYKQVAEIAPVVAAWLEHLTAACSD